MMFTYVTTLYTKLLVSSMQIKTPWPCEVPQLQAGSKVWANDNTTSNG